MGGGGGGGRGVWLKPVVQISLYGDQGEIKMTHSI